MGKGSSTQQPLAKGVIKSRMSSQTEKKCIQLLKTFPSVPLFHIFPTQSGELSPKFSKDIAEKSQLLIQAKQ